MKTMITLRDMQDKGMRMLVVTSVATSVTAGYRLPVSSPSMGATTAVVSANRSRTTARRCDTRQPISTTAAACLPRVTKVVLVLAAQPRQPPALNGNKKRRPRLARYWG
jgi:hypothetical protein